MSGPHARPPAGKTRRAPPPPPTAWLRSAVARVGRPQPTLDGPHGKLGPAGKSEPSQDLLDVVGHGARGQHEPLGDLRVGQPTGDERSDLPLARRQGAKLLLSGHAAAVPGSMPGELGGKLCPSRHQADPAGHGFQERQVALREGARLRGRGHERTPALVVHLERDPKLDRTPRPRVTPTSSPRSRSARPVR